LRSAWIVGALAVLLGAVLPPAGASAGDRGRAVEWLSDYQMGLEDALLTRRPVVLTFYTDWCGWCRKLERTTFTDPRFRDLSGSFVPVRVNGDKQRSLTALFRVRGYPTTVVLSRRGKEVGRIVGYQPPGPFVSGLTEAMSRAEPLQEVQSAAEAAPQDPRAAYALGDVLLALGRYDEARAALERAEKLDAGDAGGVADDAALDLAVSRVYAGEDSAALPLFAAFLKTHPDSDRRDQALFFYGVSLIRTGNRRDGLEKVREAAAETTMGYIKHEAARLEAMMSGNQGGQG
jgi:thioredoxin-like negative regulator of GroEL